MSTWKSHTSGPATGWLAPPGDGKNFVRTTQQLAERGTAEDQCHAAAFELVEQDLLVEDVSIDGMCGVY